MAANSVYAGVAALAWASLALPVQAQDQPQSFFDGAYVGGHVQNAVIPFNTKTFDSSGSDTTLQATITNDGVAEGPGLGSFVGVGRRNENRYYGAEAGFGLGSASYERKIDGASSRKSLLLTKESTFALSGRAGLVQTEQALIYGRLGWTNAQVEVEIEDEGVQSTNLSGWTFGAGLETPLLEVINIRGEFLYTAYSTTKISYNDGANEQKFILREKTLRLAALYRF